jgi:hypothetical protein
MRAGLIGVGDVPEGKEFGRSPGQGGCPWSAIDFQLLGPSNFILFFPQVHEGKLNLLF